MRIALKEWAVVIGGLARGRQHILLRKGGIAEGRDGFELLHREFLFYPTWEHQQENLIRPEFRSEFQDARPPSPNLIPVGYLAKVEAIRPAPESPEALAAMPHAHIWNETFLRMRYEYRPDLPLYTVLVRTFRLPQTVEVPYDSRYAGCRSWVELNQEIDVSGAQPVLTDQKFAHAAAEVRMRATSDRAREAS